MTTKITTTPRHRLTSMPSDVGEVDNMTNKCICDQCGAEFNVAPHQRTEGDLDIVYLQCPHCKQEYLVSITDSVLRDAIVEYNKIMLKARTTTDTEVSDDLARKAREMKNNNLLRSRELKSQYKQ